MRNMFAAVAIVVLAGSCFAQTDNPKAEVTDTNIIAVVLGKKITANEKDKLNELIFGVLLEQYAKENKIEPSDEELDSFLKRLEEIKKEQQVKFERDREKLQKELKLPSLSDQDRKSKESQLQTIEDILKRRTQEMKEQTKGMEKQIRPMKRQMAQHFVKAWKVNCALYRKYGGRVIFQQAGPEPLDAYRDFLKEQEKNGAFQILDKQYETTFWRYFITDSMHIFCPKDDAAKIINTPWWLMKKTPEDAVRSPGNPQP